MEFCIPISFELGGSTIHVEKVKQCFESDISVDGYAIYSQSKIQIKEDKNYSHDYKQYIFFHELIHHLFNASSDDELRKNEKLVSELATFLHQAIKTMKGKLEGVE